MQTHLNAPISVARLLPVPSTSSLPLPLPLVLQGCVVCEVGRVVMGGTIVGRGVTGSVEVRPRAS